MGGYRLGIDFGYAYTGIALLDSKNKVLDYKVLKHRNDISDTLQTRRSNRAQRRRKLSKIRRLRDFYALLKGMELEPKNAKPGQKPTEREKASLSNRLYALAHYRGWDYAGLLDMLITTNQDKPPACPPLVKKVDKILIQEFDAPVTFNEKGRKKYKNESSGNYEKARQQAKNEFDQKKSNKDSKHNQTERFSPDAISFVKIKTSCLGELYEKAKQIHELQKKLEKDPTIEEKISQLEECYRQLELQLQKANLDDIKEWLKQRLKLIYNRKHNKQEEIITRIMTLLGLQTAEELFEQGKSYRPHRNRHRSEMLSDLKKMMEIGCGLNNNAFQDCLNDTFRRLEKSNFNKKKPTLSKQEIEKDWRKQIEAVNQRASAIAGKTNSSSKKIKNKWIKSAEKILNREYRKKRFDNRNNMGKCPALNNEQKRCGLNVPTKHKEHIRKLQFEIELRQINIQRADSTKEKLKENEIEEIMSRLVFERKPTPENQTNNRETINQFFTNKTGGRYIPPAKHEARGKKDILKDIVCGDQAGRAGFCINHLKQKLQLLKDNTTQSKEWANLHTERIWTLKENAPPSIRQKVQKTVGIVRKMLKNQGISNTNNPLIEHIGIETARFDINRLAQGEGKKLKKKLKPKQYQEPLGGDKDSLVEDQDNRCLFCGDFLSSDTHTDHLFPKSKGGGNTALNKVAAHAVCNINKHRHTIPLNSMALDSIKRKNPEKYEFIKKRLESDFRLPEDMLAVPQHTMFGAKLLKGAFINELNLPKDKFKSIRPQDVSYLRSHWFPHLHRQKKALRSRAAFKTKADEEYNLDCKKLKLDKDLFDKELSIFRINKGENWLKIENKEKIIGIPKKTDTGLNKFALRDNKNTKLVMEAEKTAPGENKKKVIYRTVRERDKKLEISFKDMFSTNKRIKDQLQKSHVIIKVDFRKKDRESGNDWLKVAGDKFVGLLDTSFRENGASYIPWCNVKIINKNTEEEIDQIKIKTLIAEKHLSLIVEPSKDDPIRDFHHALDAVVLAANVDWEAIIRLNKNVRERSFPERMKILKQARDNNAPSFPDLKKDEQGNPLAPELSPRWYIEDKQNQRKLEFSKTDTQALRTRENSVFQRMPLEKIEEKNIKNIQSGEVKKAMRDAWEKIKNMDESKKKIFINENQKVSQSYFLTLGPDHILNPRNTRSVLCKVKCTLPELWQRKDEKTKGSHNFKRTVAWQEVRRIKFKNNEGKEETGHIRFAHSFYWKDKSRPNHKRNETDKELPDKYEVVKTFKAGETVQITGKNGKWKISKLGKSATLKNIETLKETSSTYSKLY